MLGSTTNLGAVGNALNVPPPPIQPRDQSSGSQMYGVGSNSQGYYPEEINCLNWSQPSRGIPSASQTPATSYFSDAGSDGYRTGSSVSRRSHPGNLGGNTPVGGQPLGLGFGPNILNPINPNRRPLGNMGPQGNVSPMQAPLQPNVVPPAQPRPLPQPVNVPANNQVQPLRQALPPAYQDYCLDANPGQPAPIPPYRIIHLHMGLHMIPILLEIHKEGVTQIGMGPGDIPNNNATIPIINRIRTINGIQN